MTAYRITEAAHIDGESECNPNFISSIKYAFPEHCHDFYEFFLITRGKCIHKVNGGSQYLTEGALVFMRPEDIHYYDYDGNNDCEFINIACCKKTIEEALSFLGDSIFLKKYLEQEMPEATILSAVEKESFISRYERLKVVSTIDKAQGRLQLRSLVVEILTQYLQSKSSVTRKEIPLWLEALLTQMQSIENFTKGICKMYELSGKSAGHLNRVFRQYLNVKPTEYINQLRLSYAKNLLLSTNLPIVEISMEAGFENLSHFYHLFKESFNTTPADLREQRRAG